MRITLLLLLFLVSMFAHSDELAKLMAVQKANINSMLMNGYSHIGQSENINEQRYDLALQRTDLAIDSTVVTLSNLLSSITDPELKSRIKGFINAARKHRATYESSAVESKYYKASKGIIEAANE